MPCMRFACLMGDVSRQHSKPLRDIGSADSSLEIAFRFVPPVTTGIAGRSSQSFDRGIP